MATKRKRRKRWNIVQRQGHTLRGEWKHGRGRGRKTRLSGSQGGKKRKRETRMDTHKKGMSRRRTVYGAGRGVV